MTDRCGFCGRDHDADHAANLAEIRALDTVVEVVTVHLEIGTYDDGRPISNAYHVALQVEPYGDVWRWWQWSAYFDPYGSWTRSPWNPGGGIARTRDQAIADGRAARAVHEKWRANYGKQLPDRFSWDLKG